MPATSTRYEGSTAYKTSVLVYTSLYQPAKIEVEIPGAEGPELAGKYSSTLMYKVDGSLASETYAAAGAIPAEGVSHSYDQLGLPARTWGGYNNTTIEYVLRTDYTRYGETQLLELGQGTKRAWLSHYFQDDTRRLERTVVDAEVRTRCKPTFHYTYDDIGNITSGRRHPGRPPLGRPVLPLRPPPPDQEEDRYPVLRPRRTDCGRPDRGGPVVAGDRPQRYRRGVGHQQHVAGQPPPTPPVRRTPRHRTVDLARGAVSSAAPSTPRRASRTWVPASTTRKWAGSSRSTRSWT
jgi:hypothetical protein